MWQIICIGPGPKDKPRRIVDRGPLVAVEARAMAIASWLRATGLYEIVRVEHSAGATRPTGRDDD